MSEPGNLDCGGEKRGERVYVHKPVLCRQLLEKIEIPSGGIVVDATVGQGGHSQALAERLGPDGMLVGLDVDPRSLEAAGERLSDASCRVELVRENFGLLDLVLNRLAVEKVNMILADLGFSSAQMEDAERGLSFQTDGPLDMRLDERLETTASELVNGLREEELADLIWRYGEERFSRRIARGIAESRRRKRLERTAELRDVISRSLGIRGEGHRDRIHPATRTFQALRIAVNDELGQLERLLAIAAKRLAPGGMIAVISFHSLEDRIVKNDFRGRHRSGEYAMVTKKPLTADEEERRENPRSRSAKLRIARRI